MSSRRANKVVNGNQATEEERINQVGEKCHMQLSILKKEDLSKSFHHFFACGIAMSEKREHCHYRRQVFCSKKDCCVQ